ncbi:MAG: response regulator [Desulfotignum sp.]|nr:response regulator [Desulfotignum sp.]MCF8089735.1 response regulator [Desulfotignum sp.]MCF8139200.1 response regulator [Desulfotignum sp.]
MKNLKKILAHVRPGSHSLKAWDEYLLFWIFFSILVFGFPALVSSIKMAFETGYYVNFFVYICFYVMMAVIVFIKKIPYKIRAWMGITLLWLLGLLALKTLGPLGSGKTYLFASAVVAGLILGVRAAFFVLVLVYGTILAFTKLYSSGTVSWELAELYNISTWNVTAITFLFLCTICTVAVSLLISGMKKTHESLEKKSNDLQRTSTELEKEIAEHKRTLSALQDSKNKLYQSQKMESIGNLAGGIAHDFNNILSSIIGFTELAMDEAPKNSGIEDSLQEVRAAGKRAKDLVKQILAFARQSDEEKIPIQPGSIAKEVLKLIRSSIPATIDIHQKIDSDATVLGNAVQVHQVLMNLCTNAAHAMEDSGGILNVTLKDVVLDEKDGSAGMVPGEYIEIKVSDTGKGIPPDIIGSIFEPYFTTKGPGEGTGMGLAMVKGIIESYHGHIAVDSQLEKGTEFTIYLPKISQRSARGVIAPETLPTGTERILFLDDEAPIAKMGSQILERLGYSVTIRTSSVEALELFRAKPDEFDLVVTDMTMPNMTGDKLAVKLMKIRPDIPVILCTGYSKKISDETATDIGIKAFAYKPVLKADLARTVREVLDEAESK